MAYTTTTATGPTAAEMASRPVEIGIKHVSMTYRDAKGNEIQALRDINLEIHKGDFVSLVGPSGCGKSTLLRLISDLETPTEGTISIQGKTPREVRSQQKFGIVFQQPVLFDWRTVRKNIELPLEVTGESASKRRETADKMLEMVGLTEFANKYPSQLSGGMQQRVNIARAFASGPEILLMDEPFSALDEFTKESLQEFTLDIWDETRKTVIFVTHNIREAVYLSNHICVLSPHPGRLTRLVVDDLPRPRPVTVKESEKFNELVGTVRSSFEGGSL